MNIYIHKHIWIALTSTVHWIVRISVSSYQYKTSMLHYGDRLPVSYFSGKVLMGNFLSSHSRWRYIEYPCYKLLSVSIPCKVGLCIYYTSTAIWQGSRLIIFYLQIVLCIIHFSMCWVYIYRYIDMYNLWSQVHKHIWYRCNHYNYEFESRSGEVYSIQHYVIKFVSDLRQVGGFLWVLQFPPPIKLAATIWLKYCWKWR
jgi:hypothetical protein